MCRCIQISWDLTSFVFDKLKSFVTEMYTFFTTVEVYWSVMHCIQFLLSVTPPPQQNQAAHSREACSQQIQHCCWLGELTEIIKGSLRQSFLLIALRHERWIPKRLKTTKALCWQWYPQGWGAQRKVNQQCWVDWKCLLCFGGFLDLPRRVLPKQQSAHYLEYQSRGLCVCVNCQHMEH